MRNFVIRNTEHFLAAVHLWGWIYYDFAFLFPQKYEDFDDTKPTLNSTAHTIICITFLCMLRTTRDPPRYELISCNPFSIIFPFIVHMGLGAYTAYVVKHEMIVDQKYIFINTQWPQYMVIPFLGTFAAIELLLRLKYILRSYMSRACETVITASCFLLVMFCFRTFFHLQISIDRLKLEGKTVTLFNIGSNVFD
ncbi:uncharacterized protein LOC116344040 [Contarinia nasturtii]|uniref:uncharacterized protein LOC116344040 n=1 Tax=Contarinia nasturtii TaxID=265458 RepID=UPI0012D4C31E|nr:uncharacterized protein LOC116344040 [Contarinia nasturtii]